MLPHIEHTKHWYSQLPVSRGIEVVLVVALLAGTIVAVTQVRGRDVIIAEQAATISRLATTAPAGDAPTPDMLRAAELDTAIVAAYGAWDTARSESARLFAMGDYQGWEGALAQVQAAQRQIDRARAQRRAWWALLYSSTGFDT
ncbi:MAG: hypothetical protein IT340_06160 [Chloroflexi bacterium]|nr:hypothetical protein [Chloroflexota bacterium]